MRSNVNDEYKTTDTLVEGRPVPGCMFGTEMLSYVLCEKYLYNTPLERTRPHFRIDFRRSLNTVGPEQRTESMMKNIQQSITHSHSSTTDGTAAVVR